MLIRSALVKGVARLAPAELSKEAGKRLKWFDYYEAHGRNGRLTCRYFGISPQTFYRWKHRYDPKHLKSLEDRSHLARHLRQPTASAELVEAVHTVREQYPRWGKDKLSGLLSEQGYKVSSSMVGRIIRRLKERGVPYCVKSKCYRSPSCCVIITVTEVRQISAPWSFSEG